MSGTPPQLMMDDAGNLTPVPADSVGDMLGVGYKPASPQQVQDWQKEQSLKAQYGTTGQAAGAFAEHAAGALTFGASDWLERAAGLSTPEAMALREKYNPVASGLGTVAGIAGPVLATMGAAAPEEAAAQGAIRGAAKLTGPGLATALGKGVTGAAEKLLPEATSLAGRIGVKAATSAVGASAEGLLYGLGQDIHEGAIGDHKLTVDSLIAHGGLGAALGGTLGGLGGAAEEAVPAAIRGAWGAVQKGAQKAQDLYPELAERLGVGDAGTIREAQTALNEAFKNPKEIASLQTDMGQAVADSANKVAEASKKLERVARPQEIEDSIRAQSPWNLSPLSSREGVLNKFDEAIAQIRSDPDLREVGYAAKLQEIRDGFESRTDNGDAVQIFNELRQARKQVDSYAYAGKGAKSFADLPFKERETIPIVRSVRDAIKEAITDESSWGPVAVQQAKLDGLQSAYIDSLKGLTKGNLGPLKSNILTKVFEGGTESMEVNPRALRTMINQMGDPASTRIMDRLGDFHEAARNYLQGMQDSYAHVPTADFDVQGLTDLVNKSAALAQRTAKQAQATRLVNSLGEGFPRGGASPLIPKLATAGGTGEGIGLMAAAPFAGPLAPVAGIYGAIKTGLGIIRDVKNVPKMIGSLSRLNRMVNDVGEHLNIAAKGVATGTKYASRASLGTLVTNLTDSGPKTAAARAADFGSHVAQINQLADPKNLHDRLTQQTKDWADHAPNTAQGLQITTAKVANFLQSKMPVIQKRGPLGATTQPSQAEIAKYERYYEAATDPVSVLKHATDGTLSKEHVEALQTLYPTLYSRMVTKVMGAAAEAKEVPFRQKIQIARLIGGDVDGREDPQRIALTQAALAPPPAPPQPKSKGMQKLSVAKRAQTGAQRISTGDEES
ncbi:MAG TPA: hypothetical protein VMT56_00360 [Candidatus Bathyarchaeia archaeon]|nr:hypothetical protein [Candidatus Bathyarchaeia archaeon]